MFQYFKTSELKYYCEFNGFMMSENHEELEDIILFHEGESGYLTPNCVNLQAISLFLQQFDQTHLELDN